MPRPFSVLLILTLLASLASAAQRCDVKLIDQSWHDSVRNRDVPVRIYLPDRPDSAPLPVIVFSHGLGGTREGYAYLATWWASHGYVCVNPEHAGSNESIYMNGDEWNTTVKAIKDPANAINRPKDVSFVIDRLEAENRPGGKIAGKLDLSRLGVAGHSFGAYTALAIAGERFVGPRQHQISFLDKRVKAAIAISERPSVSPDPARDFAQIRIPILHMTGTEDYSPMGDVQPKERRQPFDLIPPLADQYLIIFDGAAHLTFSGQRSRPSDPKSVNYQPMIQSTTLGFWDAYLKNDPAALKEVREGSLKKLVRPTDQVESKLAPRQRIASPEPDY